MRLYLLLFIILLSAKAINAQTSVVQDTKGETSLPLGSVGVVAINTKDESISFSYGIPLDGPPPAGTIRNVFNYMGAAVKGKGKNGLINVIKNDEFQYDGSIGLFYFQDRTINLNRKLQWYLSSDFLFSQFKIYDSAASIPFSKQVYDKNSQGYKVTLGANLMGRLIGNIPYVLGVAFNAGYKNNSGDMKALEVANFYNQVDPATGQVRSVQKDKSSAYAIKDYRNSLGYSNINIDFGPQLFNQCLLLLHSRWSVQEARKPQWNPAVGLYFTRAGAPLEVVAGIQLQTLDWANTAESIKTKRERTTVNIVAGFSF